MALTLAPALTAGPPSWTAGTAESEVQFPVINGAQTRIEQRKIAVITLADLKAHRLAFVSADVAEVTRSLADLISAQAAAQYRLIRGELVIVPMPRPPEDTRVRASAPSDLPALDQFVAAKIVETIGHALGQMTPVEVSCGKGEQFLVLTNRDGFAKATISVGTTVERGGLNVVLPSLSPETTATHPAATTSRALTASQSIDAVYRLVRVLLPAFRTVDLPVQRISIGPACTAIGLEGPLPPSLLATFSSSPAEARTVFFGVGRSAIAAENWSTEAEQRFRDAVTTMMKGSH